MSTSRPGPCLRHDALDDHSTEQRTRRVLRRERDVIAVACQAAGRRVTSFAGLACCGTARSSRLEVPLGLQAVPWSRSKCRACVPGEGRGGHRWHRNGAWHRVFRTLAAEQGTEVILGSRDLVNAHDLRRRVDPKWTPEAAIPRASLRCVGTRGFDGDISYGVPTGGPCLGRHQAVDEEACPRLMQCQTGSRHM